MLWVNCDGSCISGVPENFESLLIQMVKDLEDTRYKYFGYSYRRTMRNILTGNISAVIAPNFMSKEYFGIVSYLTLDNCTKIMETLVKKGKIAYVDTEHGRLYCTKDYHDHICRKGS